MYFSLYVQGDANTQGQFVVYLVGINLFRYSNESKVHFKRDSFQMNIAPTTFEMDL